MERKVCNHKIESSKPEKEVRIYLERMGIKFKPNYVMGFYEYDIFIPENKILIEVQGDYWHGNPAIYDENKLLDHQKKKKLRDKQKRTFAENRGYKLLEIWEKDIKNNCFDALEELC